MHTMVDAVPHAAKLVLVQVKSAQKRSFSAAPGRYEHGPHINGSLEHRRR